MGGASRRGPRSKGAGRRGLAGSHPGEWQSSNPTPFNRIPTEPARTRECFAPSYVMGPPQRGGDSPAQGNALGRQAKRIRPALKGRNLLWRWPLLARGPRSYALSGRDRVLRADPPGRCPGLTNGRAFGALSVPRDLWAAAGAIRVCAPNSEVPTECHGPSAFPMPGRSPCPRSRGVQKRKCARRDPRAREHRCLQGTGTVQPNRPGSKDVGKLGVRTRHRGGGGEVRRRWGCSVGLDPINGLGFMRWRGLVRPDSRPLRIGQNHWTWKGLRAGDLRLPKAGLFGRFFVIPGRWKRTEQCNNNARRWMRGLSSFGGRPAMRQGRRCTAIPREERQPGWRGLCPRSGDQGRAVASPMGI
jgi:hypothetical protein